VCAGFHCGKDSRPPFHSTIDRALAEQFSAAGEITRSITMITERVQSSNDVAADIATRPSGIAALAAKLRAGVQSGDGRPSA
jgi:hypothetical protein